MKASEEIGLLLKGVKPAEIAALKEREAAEAAEAEEEKKAAEEAAKVKEAAEEKQDDGDKSALETAQALVKDLESKLSAKEDELTKLNAEFAKLNNKQTVTETPESRATGADVFKELFHPKKDKEV